MPSIGSRGRREHRDPAAAGGDRLLAFLPLLAFLLYALTSPGLIRGDAAGVYATAAALVEHGTFAIDGATAALAPAPAGADIGAARSGPLAYAAGHYYHDAPPGPAILAAPAYALGLALAPPLGPEAPALLVGLLGPLLGALAVAGLARLPRAPGSAPGRLHPALPAAAGAILLLPWVHAPAAPVVAAALACWLLPALVALWRGRAAPLQAGAVGLGLAAFLLLDYGLGLLAAAVLLATLARLRRGPQAMVALLAGAAGPVLVLAAYATVAFGRPWRPAFLFAVDRAAGARLDLSRPAALVAVGVPLAVALAVALIGLASQSRPALARPIRAAALALTLALAPWRSSPPSPGGGTPRSCPSTGARRPRCSRCWPSPRSSRRCSALPVRGSRVAGAARRSRQPSCSSPPSSSDRAAGARPPPPPRTGRATPRPSPSPSAAASSRSGRSRGRRASTILGACH